MSTDGQGTKCHRKIADNYNCLSGVHQHYRRQTDGWVTAYSERERELTFPNKSRHAPMSSVVMVSETDTET